MLVSNISLIQIYNIMYVHQMTDFLGVVCVCIYVYMYLNVLVEVDSANS